MVVEAAYQVPELTKDNEDRYILMAKYTILLLLKQPTSWF